MFLLVFVVLLGTVVTVNDDKPEVELHSDIADVGSVIGRHRMLTCRSRGFNTSDIILIFKKSHCVLTEEDGVETTGVKPQGKTYWRRDHVTVPQSEVSHYSCEVVHAASRFRVEKLWDSESDGGGRIISSEFIDTNPPEVKMFPENSEVQTNIILTCLVSGFYPNNITLNMKRNGRILTREDGVESSGVCSNGNGTFQRRDSVEIKKSDKSNFSCEVIHHASGSRVEKIWDHSLPHSDGAGHIIHGAVMVVVGLVLVVVASAVLVVLKKRRILGAVAERDEIKYSDEPTTTAAPPPGANGVKVPLAEGTTQSHVSLNTNNNAGHDGSQSGGSGSDSGSSSNQSGSTNSSDVPASTIPVPGSPDSGTFAEAESLLNENDPANV